MNVRHAYSKEDPSPDERYLWGSLVDDSDALALLRIGYAAGRKADPQEIQDAWEEGDSHGYADGFRDGQKEAAA